MTPRKNKVVIVGAGAAGLFAARALKKQGLEPTIIEKQPHVGGKCRTYSDATSPEIKTEWGAAMVAPNYGVVLDAVIEKGIEFEESVGTRRDTVGVLQKLDMLSWQDQAYFAAQLVSQVASFTYAVSQYHYARDNHLPLPEDFELPFAQYAKKYGIEDISLLVKPLVSGFGYGAMDDIPAYCVMEYMGIGTIPAIALEKITNQSAIIGIKGGTQKLMEKVAEDFNVITSADIHSIDRTEGNITVSYTADGVKKDITGDTLVLALPPMHWPKLGMQLTEVEQQCVNDINYHPYPVAVCKVKGLVAEHVFIPDALEKEGFGHLSLVTTRDNRPEPKDGRLCTTYFNLLPNENEFSLDKGSVGRNLLTNELKTQLGVQEIKILGTKIWQDYMPTLAWEQRLKLEAEQMRDDTSTLYVGAYPLGGFEDIRCVADQATRAVKKHIFEQDTNESLISYTYKELSRAYGFFNSIPRVQPVQEASPLDQHNHRSNI